MKNRIAVATDFSQNSMMALTKAIYLAKTLKYTLDVVHIVEYSIFRDPKKDKRAGKEALSKFLNEHFPSTEVEIQQFCYVGALHKKLNSHIRDRECRLLCIGAAGESQHLTAVFLGSTTKKIVKNSPIPVLVAKNESVPDYLNIFSPTDFSDISFEFVKTIEKFFVGANFIFYHMINRPFELRLGHYGANEDQISKYNTKLETKAKARSQEFLNHFNKKDKTQTQEKVQINKKDKNQTQEKAQIVLDSGILSYARLLSVADSKNASVIALPTSGKISFFALDVLQNSHLDVVIWKV